MFNPEENALMLRLAGGGVALGGGLGMLAALAKLALKPRITAARENEFDDDTMYLYKKSSTGVGPMAKGLGAIGLLAGGVGGFAIVNAIVNKLREKQAQEELDKAQRMLLNVQGYDTLSKKAAGPISGLIDDVAAGAIVVGGLVALAGGVAGWQYMDSKYPKYEAPRKEKLTRFRIIDAEPEYVKEASALLGEEISNAIANTPDDDALELSAHLLYTTHKSASAACDIARIVAGGCENMLERSIEDIGFEDTLDYVKYAADKHGDKSDAVNHAAISYCIKQASFAPQYKLLVATEFANMHPDMYEVASELKPEYAANMLHLAKAASYIFNAGVTDVINGQQDTEDDDPEPIDPEAQATVEDVVEDNNNDPVDAFFGY